MTLAEAPSPASARPDPPPRLDALLPPEMARLAEQTGVGKASLDTLSLLTLAVLAGAFIALGAVFSTVVLAGAERAPWGVTRLLAGVAFSLGLILVVVGGAELFTGNNLIVMAWAGGRVSTRALLRNWAVVYVGNFLGALSIALAVYLAGSHEAGAGAFGAAALRIAAAKLRPDFLQAVVLGVLANTLVCLAVWLSYSARTTTDRVLVIVPPVSAFVAAGFEHSVANMYFVPFGLLVAVLDPAFTAARGLEAEARALTWTAFALRNLLPVTLGNLVGGSVLVGAVYWFVYLRPRRAP
ncbi:MAG TPA: formate/nitrite family transporter [Methylomirabilota bacterium]|nr:formate/nitrite family transporter [Methylomirabilota bacterium]